MVWCPDPPLQRPWEHREIRSHRDLQTVLRGVGAQSRRLVRKVLGWLMDSGRLLEYSLARRLELEIVAFIFGLWELGHPWHHVGKVTDCEE